MEASRIHLYTEDHRHPAVITGSVRVDGQEYVPVTIPCKPSHPSVSVDIFKWQAESRNILLFSFIFSIEF